MRRVVSRWIFLCIAAAGAAGLALAGAAAPLPGAAQSLSQLPSAKPVPPGAQAKVLLYLAAPNVDTLLSHLELAAARFAPGKLQPGMLKAQWGVAMSDPQFANLAPGPVLALLYQPPASSGVASPAATAARPAGPQLAVLIPALQAAPYDQALTRWGFKTAYVEGLVLAAKTTEGLDLARWQIGLHKRLGAASIKSDVRIFVDLAALEATYGPRLQKAFDSANADTRKSLGAPQPSGAPDPGAVAQLMSASENIMMTFCRQAASLQCDLTLAPDELAADVWFTARPGSDLAALLTAPQPGSNKATAIVGPSDMIYYAARVNPEALNRFVSSVADSSGLAKFSSPFLAELLDVMYANLQGFTGDAAISMNLSPRKAPELKAAMGAADPTVLLAGLEHSAASFGPDGELGRWYAAMGLEISATFERDARRRGDVPVHRWSTSLESPATGEQPPPGFRALDTTTEYAFVNGWWLAASKSADLDAMIDRVQSGVPDRTMALLNAGPYGANHQIYFEYDFARLLKIVMERQPAFAGSKEWAQAQGGKPIVGVADVADGRVLVRVRAPLAPFAQLGQAMRDLVTQHQQDPPHAPAPAPSPHD